MFPFHFVQKTAHAQELSLSTKLLGSQDGEGRAGLETLHGQDIVSEAQRKQNCQGAATVLTSRAGVDKYMIHKTCRRIAYCVQIKIKVLRGFVEMSV